VEFLMDDEAAAHARYAGTPLRRLAREAPRGRTA